MEVPHLLGNKRRRRAKGQAPIFRNTNLRKPRQIAWMLGLAAMVRLPKIAHFSQAGSRSAFSGQLSGLQLCFADRAENTLSMILEERAALLRLCKLHGYNSM